jgi:hypothetical protein
MYVRIGVVLLQLTADHGPVYGKTIFGQMDTVAVAGNVEKHRHQKNGVE